MAATNACAGGDSTFTWDSANDGWCACCTDVADAIRYTVKTRDKECKIYQQKNDRSIAGVTVWNGKGYTGDKETFSIGWYDVADLRTIGNDKLWGVDVPAQFKVTLY